MDNIIEIHKQQNGDYKFIHNITGLKNPFIASDINIEEYENLNNPNGISDETIINWLKTKI